LRKTKNKVLFFKHGLILVCIVMLIAGLWYIPNTVSIQKGLYLLKKFSLEENDPTGFYQSVILYTKYLYFGLSPLLFWLTVLSSIFSLLFKKGRSIALLIYPTIIFSFLSFCLISNKDQRYMLPLFVFFPTILIGGIYYVKRISKLLYKVVFISILIYCFLIKLSLTFGWPNIKSDFYPSPVNANYQNWSVVDVVMGVTSKKNDKPPHVIVIPDNPYINWLTLQYYSEALNINAIYQPLIEGLSEKILPHQTDYVVNIEPIDAEYKGSPYAKRVIEYEKRFESTKYLFQKVNSYTLPDNSTLFLYKRIGS